MQDVIKREIVIKAPKERVYAAIADPTQITKWFPDTIEGTLEKGEQSIFGFGESGQTKVIVEATQPHEYFAFRWVPGSDHSLRDVVTMPNTLVEFRIQETEGACTVTLTESGFASLPVEMAEKSLKQNSGGWDYMLGRLEKHFDQQ